MISKITIVCFAASYGVALLLEVWRLMFRSPIRPAFVVGMTAAGMVAHSLYLWHRATNLASGGLPLSSWYDWYLVAAWIVAATYLLLSVARPQASVGLFLLPLTLLILGVAYNFQKSASFPREQAISAWGIAHGVALLLGTVTVTLGFAAGVMYLVQSYRLKHHLPPREGFRLPSLEWLQQANQQMLVVSTFLVALGLLAGIVLNAVRRTGSGAALPWTDSVVLTSSLLLLWLIAASTFEFLYKPAQQGRKVAYLTVASFIFLVLALGMSVWGGSQHTAPRGDNAIVTPQETSR